MNDAIKMQISAFVDGELPDNESQLLLRRLCQDIELRRQAAEYFGIGRAMRGERGVAGMDKLRERIAAAIDERSTQGEFGAIEVAPRSYLRPAAGLAIAASVTVAAILGFQQLNGGSELGVAPPAEIAADAGQRPSYTVPDVHRERHTMESGNLDALLATFELREVDMNAADTVRDKTNIDAAEMQDRQAP